MKLINKNTLPRNGKINSKYTKSHSQEQVLANQLNNGNSLMEQENYEAASKIYAKILEKQPKNSVALNNLGAALVRMGRTSDAKKILEYALEINPKDFNARINLGGVYQAEKDFKGALDNALETISISPNSAIAFNNLGCALGGVGMLKEALHAYETAGQLDSNYLEAKLNVAMTLGELGRPNDALYAFEVLINEIPLNRPQFAGLARFFYSFVCLQLGHLKTGWENYENGFNQTIPIGAPRTPFRVFDCPQWRGEDLTDKSLLVWREQGIGDEILFSSILVDFVDEEKSITFECSPRLKDLYQRTFPNFNIIEEGFDPITRKPLSDENFDYHIPIGSLPLILRNKIESFDKQRPFFIINQDFKNEFEKRLNIHNDKKKIGICWRSGLLDPSRNKHFTSISDWGNILNNKEYVFVNLQYGECESELIEAEEKFGIEIIRWNDLDLKNDLDKVAALMACLDCVISAETAVSQMAGSIGVPTILITLRSWTSLGAEPGRLPWHPNTILCTPPLGEVAALALPEIPEKLDVLLKKKWSYHVKSNIGN